MTNPSIDDVTTYLTGAGHVPAEHNEHGSCIVAGFRVGAGLGGCARVSYRMPAPDLSDPDRSREESRAEREAMVAALADVLDLSPWIAARQTAGNSREPIILVRRAGGVTSAGR